MQRYKLTIAYRGTRYHGWLAQPVTGLWKGPPPEPGEGIPTVQRALVKAIAPVVGHPLRLIGASRTDAGVHAKGQIAHFDTTQTQIPPHRLRHAVNARLPADILVRAIEAVPQTFDAVKSTTSKRYQYAIWNARDRPTFFGDLAWHRWQKLDVEAMRESARRFVGEHDFTSFARPGHGRLHAVRTIFGCEVHWRLPRIIIGIEGSGFLWNMVRIMVGTLVYVGLGRFQPDDITRMLEAKDRTTSGPTAPAHGLYLQWIKTT